MELSLFEKMASTFGLLDAHSMAPTTDNNSIKTNEETKTVSKKSSKEPPWWVRIRQETPTLNFVRVDDPIPSSTPSSPTSSSSDLTDSRK
jgi:hypothetical protein